LGYDLKKEEIKMKRAKFLENFEKHLKLAIRHSKSKWSMEDIKTDLLYRIQEENCPLLWYISDRAMNTKLWDDQSLYYSTYVKGNDNLKKELKAVVNRVMVRVNGW
jgi:hypothetical protein